MNSDHRARRFSIRFALEKDEHKIAWEKLSDVPNGKRTEFIIQAILEKTDSHPLKIMMEKMYMSLENKLASQQSEENYLLTKNNEEIAQNVLNFMKGL